MAVEVALPRDVALVACTAVEQLLVVGASSGNKGGDQEV